MTLEELIGEALVYLDVAAPRSDQRPPNLIARDLRRHVCRHVHRVLNPALNRWQCADCFEVGGAAGMSQRVVDL